MRPQYVLPHVDPASFRIGTRSARGIDVNMTQPGSRTSRAAMRRGFTLTELMVVIAMIGVLAAIAMVGYRKYMKSAAASEVKSVVQGIRLAEEAYRSETLQYLGCSANLTDWYPAAPDGHKRHFDTAQTGQAKHDCWMSLNVHTDGPVQFGYTVVAGVATQPNSVPNIAYCDNWAGAHQSLTGPWFVVQAAGDQDSDGIYSMWASSSNSGQICLNPQYGDDE